MKPSPPWGIGIIGLGVMGRRMAEALGEHPAFRVVAAFDPAPQATPAPFPMLGSAEAVAAHPEVDCVYIASPPAWHHAHVAAVAAARKPVFCEKPLAATVAEADAICAAIRGAGVAAGVNFPFSTSAAAVRLRQLVQQGELGTVQGARLTLRFAQWPRRWQQGAASWLAGPEQGGFTREVASHFLFLAGRLFGRGEIESAAVRRGPAGTEDKLVARIRFGATVLTIDAEVAGDIDDHNRLEVQASAGSAAITDWQRLDYQGRLSERENATPSQLDALSRLLAGQGDHGLASPEEAAEVVRLVEGMLAAAG